MAKAVGEKREAWKMIEGIRDRWEQPSTGLKHLYGQKKKAARRAVDRARRSMEEALYRKLVEDAGKNIVLGDVSNCSYRLTVHPVTSSRFGSAYQFVYAKNAQHYRGDRISRKGLLNNKIIGV